MYNVRPLRLGNFSAILEMFGDGLDVDGAGEGARAASRRAPSGGPWRSSDQVQYAFDRMTGANPCLSPGRIARLYGEAPSANPETPGQQKPKAPPRRRKTDSEAVTEELHLDAARNAGDLHRIRRNFALRNHPDRVPHGMREEATRRMTIANALIDSALKARAISGGI